MAEKPPQNLDHVWITSGLSASTAEKKRAGNLASLKRKVTYCLSRPSEPLQYQSVEGWSARQVLDFMRAAGVPAERIKRGFGVQTV